MIKGEFSLPGPMERIFPRFSQTGSRASQAGTAPASVLPPHRVVRPIPVIP